MHGPESLPYRPGGEAPQTLARRRRGGGSKSSNPPTPASRAPNLVQRRARAAARRGIGVGGRRGRRSSGASNSTIFGYAGVMKLGFEKSQSSYSSGSQNARAWTEAWVSAWAYCPHCGNAKISSFPNNSPLADFFCTSCSEEFELKSQRQVWREGCGWRVQDQVRTAGRKQQSEPSAHELRSQISSGRQPLYRAKAFLRPRDHRGAQAAGGDRASCGMDRLENSARSVFRSPAEFISSRTASFERRSSSSRSGKRRFSSGMNRRKRAAGCSTS